MALPVLLEEMTEKPRQETRIIHEYTDKRYFTHKNRSVYIYNLPIDVSSGKSNY